MNELLIIDGHNLLFQMFFGMPAGIRNKDGKLIHGTLGFVGGLIKIIRMVGPTHVIVIFDGEKGNERTDINGDYKANRIDYTQVPEEENPFSQYPDILKALEHMNITYVETQGFETDDLAASYAITYRELAKITISSFDSDFFQLIDENTQVLRYRGEQTLWYDGNRFQEKYGISPRYYADYKAMVGDSADNIKGVEGVGPKTAAKLINDYGDIKSIIENAESIPRVSLRSKILNNINRIKENFRLIKLENKIPLPFALEQLQYDAGRLPNTTDVLKQIGLK